MVKIEYGRGGTIGIGNEPPQRRFNTNYKANNYATNKTNFKTKIQEESRNEMRTENANERLNLMDVVNRISNRIALTPQQEEINERAKQKAKENGITAVGQFNFEMRAMIDDFGTKSGRTIAHTQSAEYDEDFIEKITFYPTLKANIKAPYFDENTCDWKEVGYGITANTDTITSKYLTPHRLTTQVDFSVDILRQNGSFYNEVNEILIKAIFNKLVESILSDSAETSDKPKGIFNGVSCTTISTIADLATLQYDGDKQKTKNAWIISPKAKAEILKLNPIIFNDGKFLGSEYIFENRLQDGLIAYLPLNLVTVAQFGAVEVTVDNITDVVNGNVKTYIDTYFDFDFLDENKIQLGTFNVNETQETNEPNDEPNDEPNE